MCLEIKSAEGVLFTKVEAKVVASGISGLPVEEVEILFVIKVAEAVLDVLIA